MITHLEDNALTNRSWNGRDDIRQHYTGHFPLCEHVLSLALYWKQEKHTPLFEIGKFLFYMQRLVNAGYARVHDQDYVIRFQRTDRNIEVAVNRSSPALQLASLPDAYFER